MYKKILSMAVSFVMIISASFQTLASTDTPITDIYDVISDGIASSACYLGEELSALYAENGVTDGFEWYITALLRAGKTIDEDILEQYYNSVVLTVAEWSEETKPTDIARTALAMTVMGKDISDINGTNLAELIYSSPRLCESSNELAYALIALDASQTEIPAEALFTKDEIVAELLNFQTAEGSFGLQNIQSGDIDVTAICIQALAPYQENPQVEDAVQNAVVFLKSTISENYSYSDNPNTTSQVLMALAILGKNVTDTAESFGDESSNIITALNSFKNTAGSGYLYGDNVNAMATIQIMQAYDAYRKSHQENLSYWNFSQVGNSYDDVFAEEDTEEDTNTEKADSAVIYVTIASGGNVVADKNGGYMAQTPVVVEDYNEDGRLTVDEALFAAHENYCPEGSEGYSSYSGIYGLSIAILWGEGTEQTSLEVGYWLNNASCWSLEDTVAEGDYLTAFVYSDKIYWSDAYSYFTQNEVTVKPGEYVDLELKYLSGYDAENGYAPIYSACSEANIKFLSSNNSIQGNLKTNSDGKVQIAFSASANSGDHFVIAYKEDATIVPAVCKITVEDNTTSGSGGNREQRITAYIKVFDPKGQTYLSRTSYIVERGITAYKLLEITGLDIEVTRSAYGIYINSIEGLAEFDEGSESGWMFRVNGKFPEHSISSYKLSDGDYLEIVYTRNMGKDVGDNSERLSSGGKSSKDYKEYYTVKFKTDDASKADKQKIEKNGYASEPDDPIKEGYEFAGWYYDEKYEKAYSFETKVTEDITLYAKWIKTDADESIFKDVKEIDWYYNSVKFVYDNNLMNGTDKGFEPDLKMTRAMLVTVLWRMENSPESHCLDLFEDVNETDWYASAVLWAAENGIVSGIGGNLFAPSLSVTRAEAAQIVYNVLKQL